MGNFLRGPWHRPCGDWSRPALQPGDVCPDRDVFMTDVLRFIGGAVILAIAAMTALPAPTHLLWALSIAATEYGYWIAIAAILPLIPTRRQAVLGKLGALFSLAAIPLLMLPVYRARAMAAELPHVFEAKLGAERRVRAEAAGDPRPEPLILRELVRPLDLPAIRYEERTFATHPGQTLTLDLYRPAYVHGTVPCVIVVHGGSWQTGSNTEFAALNAYLAGRDYVVAAINYRLAPRWKFPASSEDVKAAIDYIKVHAGEFGADPARLVLLGRAEGGQLALLAAYSAQDPAIRGVVSVYSPSDLRAAYEHPSPAALYDTRAVLEAYVGGPPAKVDQQYHDASPVNFVTASTPPTLLIHGARDQTIAVDQSAQLDQRLLQAGVKHVFVNMPWATHGCDKSFGGPCGQITLYAVERFLDSVTLPLAAAPARGRRGKAAQAPSGARPHTQRAAASR
jgi:acetyl esterase/lipase